MQWPPCEMSGMESSSRGGVCPCLLVCNHNVVAGWLFVGLVAHPMPQLSPPPSGSWDAFVRPAEAAPCPCADLQPLLHLVCSDEQRKKEYEERQAARKAREVAHKPAKYEQEVSG